jgi:Holliday junction resolvase RusA-like endonuclease
MIDFTVHAVPVPQPRPRAFSRNGHAAVYEAPRRHPVHAFKALVRLAAMEHAGPALEGPLAVAFVFVMPRPKAMCWKTRPTPRVPHDSKPDLDNLQKSILDALSILWHDDAQVAKVDAEKWVAAGDEVPHVRVRVEQIGGEE